MRQTLQRMFAIAGLLITSILLSTTAGAAGVNGNNASDQTTDRARVDTGYALVQLNGEPLATYVKTKPPRGKKIDFSSATVKSYRAQLQALRNDFKSWLRGNAPRAKVSGEFDLSLNAVSLQLNGVPLATIAAAPMVLRAEYHGLYYPNVADPDLALIGAPQAWNLGGGAALAGAGVKVAIVDTGIDASHPCFGDAGYPAQSQAGDTRYTNNKVIAAKVFNNKSPSRHYTAEALQEHGTHVAGTVACNDGTPASVNGVAISHPISGVAPRALLGNYNVFPGDVTSARSEDILNALEAAYLDGFDVANMSLGGGASGIQDLLTIAVDNLDQANMVVAVAAGNSGPGHYTIESPGSAARALTAGAATVGHYLGAPVAVSGSTYGATVGSFATVSADLAGILGVVTEGALVNGIGNACAALTPGSLLGQVALISRGTCTFSTKIRNAQNAGAAAVLVANNVAGDGIAMGQDGTPSQPTVAAYMLSRSDGLAVKANNGAATTIAAAMQYFVSGNDDFMAGFSSQGPTDVDFRVKPDVVAPGVNVLSSIPHQFCAAPPCFAFFQGTSMATPHLAGSAAVVRWLHPDWSAAQVRSAIVNTAAQGVLKQSTSIALQRDVNVIGAGREDLLSAAGAQVALDPVSISFGAIPSGSGQTRSTSVTLTNLTGSPQTFDVSVGAGDASVAYSVAPAFVTLLAGESGVITLTMRAQMGAGEGNHQATLTLRSGGAEVAHAAVYTFIK
ncbi:MAG: S8 family serine peptidase [Betaproteobacteria bacterium]|nr:S8 family serine peptidase [Betaproteobacteria bacterium]